MFKRNKIYKRSELHDQYGGTRQSGISPSGMNPIIFIFSGKGSEKHGYDDGWSNDGFYYYTGLGQEGDMTFTRGNKAIRDHKKEGKRLFLFEAQEKIGYCKHISELEYTVDQNFVTPDTSGKTEEVLNLSLEKWRIQQSRKNKL